MFFAHYSLQCPLRVGRILFKSNALPITRRPITTTPIRNDIFNIGKRMKHEPHYKQMDKIEPGYELIYRAPFEYLTAFCRHVPTFSLIVASSLIAYKWAAGIEIIETHAEITMGPVMSDETELIGFSIAFYIVNIALVYFVTKYPLRIYKGKNHYVAMFEGFIPRSPRQYSFPKGDVTKTQSILREMIPWHESMYKIKDRTAIVFSHHFKKPSDFHDMLKIPTNSESKY